MQQSTLIDETCDNVVLSAIAPDLIEKSRKMWHCNPSSWCNIVNVLFQELWERGLTEYDIISVIEAVDPLVSKTIVELLEFIKNYGEAVVLSDSNTLYIENTLRVCNVRHYFTGVFANRAEIRPGFFAELYCQLTFLQENLYCYIHGKKIWNVLVNVRNVQQQCVKGMFCYQKYLPLETVKEYSILEMVLVIYVLAFACAHATLSLLELAKDAAFQGYLKSITLKCHVRFWNGEPQRIFTNRSSANYHSECRFGFCTQKEIFVCLFF